MRSHIQIIEPSEEPLTLEEAKLHLRVDSDGDDALISALIVTARTHAEAKMRRAIMPQTWRLSLSDFSRWPVAIELPCPKVISVTEITYIDPNGDEATMPPAAYRLFHGSIYSYLLPTYDGSWPSVRCEPGAVRIVYQAGYASPAAVPAPIKSWMKIFITTLYENREALGDKKDLSRNYIDGLLDPFIVSVLA